MLSSSSALLSELQLEMPVSVYLQLDLLKLLVSIRSAHDVVFV